MYTWEGSQWGEEGALPSHILGAYQRGIIMSFFGAGRNISGLAMIYGGGGLFLYIRFGSQILTLLHEHIHVLGDTLFTYLRLMKG